MMLREFSLLFVVGGGGLGDFLFYFLGSFFSLMFLRAVPTCGLLKSDASAGPASCS